MGSKTAWAQHCVYWVQGDTRKYWTPWVKIAGIQNNQSIYLSVAVIRLFMDRSE